MQHAVAGFIAALSLSIGSARGAVAQNSARRPQSSVDSVRLAADLFFRAVADERWQAAATMVDTTLMRFIVAQRLRWQRQVTRPDLTVEDFMRDDPAKPRIVAEYELKRYRELDLSVGGVAVSSEFAGVTSLLELARLTAAEATARYLQAQDPRIATREAARRAGCADSTPQPPATLHRILGVALPSDTIAYVLHEDATPQDETRGLPRSEPMVMQLRLRSRRWIIIPGSALLRPAGNFGTAVQCGELRQPSS